MLHTTRDTFATGRTIAKKKYSGHWNKSHYLINNDMFCGRTIPILRHGAKVKFRKVRYAIAPVSGVLQTRGDGSGRVGTSHDITGTQHQVAFKALSHHKSRLLETVINKMSRTEASIAGLLTCALLTP